MLANIQETLSETLRMRVLALFGHAVERVVLTAPPRLELGDLATPLAIELARPLKKAPRAIAEAIVAELELPSLVRSVSVEGAGYLNFRLDRGGVMAEMMKEPLARPLRAGERVIVEHTNINPNKAAHIGHLRNAVLGDTLVRCLRWLGHHVETQNYIDDTGVQVADVVVGFQHLLGEGPEQVRARIDDQAHRFDYFCWDLYSRVGRHYEENPEAVALQKETLHSIEKHEGMTAELGAMVAEAIVRWHVRTALRLSIEYDVLTKESDIIQLNFWSRAFEKLKESGAVVLETEGKHAGCWVMRLTDSPEFTGMEEPDKILVRSNGTVTYVGKDIAYQLWKFGLIDRTFGYREFLRYEDGRVLWETTTEAGESNAPRFGNADRVYNVIDVRQAYLQKVVREGLRQLGHAAEAEKSIHFAYEMVALTPATARALGIEVSDEDAQRAFLEMSGRKGIGVKADDLMDELERKASEAVTRSGRGESAGLSGSDLEKLTRQIAVAALRYFMLKFGRNKVLAFDFAEALTFEGDSGPYLQYSTVRADNIFRKMAERGVQVDLGEHAIDLLASGDVPDEIWDLIRAIADTPQVVGRAVDSLELSMVTRHALELAQKFNHFYHRFPVLSEEDPDERTRRAACADLFRRSMREIFDLIGLEVPDRM